MARAPVARFVAHGGHPSWHGHPFATLLEALAHARTSSQATSGGGPRAVSQIVTTLSEAGQRGSHDVRLIWYWSTDRRGDAHERWTFGDSRDYEPMVPGGGAPERERRALVARWESLAARLADADVAFTVTETFSTFFGHLVVTDLVPSEASDSIFMAEFAATSLPARPLEVVTASQVLDLHLPERA